MLHLKIRNWEKYQHYKDRNPPWIKLHYSLLSSKDWVMMEDAERVLAVACMLIASQAIDEPGTFEADPEYFRRVAYLNQLPDFKPLIKCGFLEVLADASGCKQMLADARPEKEKEKEAETEKRRGDIVVSPEGEPDCLATKAAKEILVEANRIHNLGWRKPHKFLKGRLRDGATAEDCLAVIANRVEAWQQDEKMRQYIRQETLFREGKFEGYLQASKGTPKDLEAEERYAQYSHVDVG